MGTSIREQKTLLQYGPILIENKQISGYSKACKELHIIFQTGSVSLCLTSTVMDLESPRIAQGFSPYQNFPCVFARVRVDVSNCSVDQGVLLRCAIRSAESAHFLCLVNWQLSSCITFVTSNNLHLRVSLLVILVLCTLGQN